MNDYVLMAASQEMNEHGLKFTMENVAARLGISKKTLYQYYSSKDALITGVIDVYIADITTQQQEVIAKGGNFDEIFRAVALLEPQKVCEFSPRLRAEIIKYRPADWKKIQSFCHGRAQDVIWYLEKGKEWGDVRSINSKVAACMIFSMAEGIFQKRFLEESNLTFSDAFEAAIDIFLYGIMNNQD